MFVFSFLIGNRHINVGYEIADCIFDDIILDIRFAQNDLLHNVNRILSQFLIDESQSWIITRTPILDLPSWSYNACIFENERRCCFPIATTFLWNFSDGYQIDVYVRLPPERVEIVEGCVYIDKIQLKNVNLNQTGLRFSNEVGLAFVLKVSQLQLFSPGSILPNGEIATHESLSFRGEEYFPSDNSRKLPNNELCNLWNFGTESPIYSISVFEEILLRLKKPCIVVENEDCIYHARSSYLRCTANPTVKTCLDCTEYKPI